MSRKAIIRVDASTEIGGGHVSRCLTLANKLSEEGTECTFVTIVESKMILPSLANSKHQIHYVEKNAHLSLLNILEKQKPDLLIFDHYGIDADIEEKCQPYTQCIMVIDDLPVRKHYCDVLLDQTIGREPIHYQGLNQKPDPVLLLGSQFGLLRPEFLKLRQTLYGSTREKINRLLINFGASDLFGHCEKAVNAAVLSGINCIDIAVSSATPNLDTLKLLSERYDTKVNLYIDADMPMLMSKADLAIGAAGVTALERCCLGLPTIVSSLADNQSKIAESLHVKGAAIQVNPTEKEFYDAIQEIMNTPNSLSNMSKSAYELCDGNGLDRVIKVLENYDY